MNVIPLKAQPKAGSEDREVPLADRSDDDLIRLCRSGRPGAFSALVARHQTRAVRTAYRRLGNAEAARDVVQEAFMVVFRTLDRYEPRGLFVPYLHRIVLNGCRTAERGRRREVSAMDRLSREPERTQAQSDDVLLALDRQVELGRRVRALSPPIRDVMVLRFAGGLSIDEIGGALDIKEGTVKSRIHAGVQRLLREERP